MTPSREMSPWSRVLPGHNHSLMRCAVFFLCLALTAGCARSGALPVVLTEEERVLMTQLTRDPFIISESMIREDDGFVTVRTRQGDTVAYYRLMPATDAKTELSIRRLDEQLRLQVTWSEDHLGTGAPPRGLSR